MTKGFFSDFFGFISNFLGFSGASDIIPEETIDPVDINNNEENIMSKKAPCIGINNYRGSSNDLRGCVNDAKGWSGLLKDMYQFEDVSLLLDQNATIPKVKKLWKKLISDANAGDTLVLTYSGHGTSTPDRNGDEADGKDEAICLYDGLLIDDTIRDIFAKKKEGVKLVFISDSCHSGTVTRAFMDALYEDDAIYAKARYLPPEDDVDAFALGSFPAPKKSIFSPKEEDMNHILISGCLPTEYSYDARIGGRYQGAMSYNAISILRNNPEISYQEFYKQLRKKLPNRSWPQTPQLEGRKDEKASLMFS